MGVLGSETGGHGTPHSKDGGAKLRLPVPATGCGEYHGHEMRRTDGHDEFLSCHEPEPLPMDRRYAAAFEYGLHVVRGLWSLRSQNVEIVAWRHGRILFRYRNVGLYASVGVGPHTAYSEWGCWQGDPKNPKLIPVESLRQEVTTEGGLKGGVPGVSPPTSAELRDRLPVLLDYLLINGTRLRLVGSPVREPAVVLHLGHHIQPRTYLLIEPVIVGYDADIPKQFIDPALPMVVTAVRARVIIRVTASGANPPSLVRFQRVILHRNDFTVRLARGPEKHFEVRLESISGGRRQGRTEPLSLVFPEPGVYWVDADLEDWDPEWITCQRMLDGRTIGSAWSEPGPPNRCRSPLMAVDAFAAWQVETNKALGRLTWVLVGLGVVTILATILTPLLNKGG